MYIIVVLSGCSWFDSKPQSAEQPAKLLPLENKINAEVVKKVSVGGGSAYDYVKLAPFVLNDHVFVASRDGNVIAYDLNSGNQIWQVSLESSFSAGPYATEDKVYVCDSDGEITALARVSGKQLWKATVSSEILSRTVESDGFLIARTADGSIFALNSETGEQKWVFDKSLPVLTLRGTGDPVVANGIVYAGLDNGKLVAIDLISGSAVWEQQVAIGRGRSEVERIIDIDGTPELHGGKIYLASYRAKLGAYSVRDGREFWSRDLSSYSGPVVDTIEDGKFLYLTDDRSHIWGISADSGASLWKQESLQARKITKPAVFGNYIVVSDFEGYLHFLNKNTGEIIARLEVFDSAIRQQAVIYKNYILVQNEEGQAAVVTVSQ